MDAGTDCERVMDTQFSDGMVRAGSVVVAWMFDLGLGDGKSDVKNERLLALEVGWLRWGDPNHDDLKAALALVEQSSFFFEPGVVP
jgi:hypothetical protein